jgi:hypothetical protein
MCWRGVNLRICHVAKLLRVALRHIGDSLRILCWNGHFCQCSV